MGVYRIHVEGKKKPGIVAAPNLAEAATYYAENHPDDHMTHGIEGAGLAEVLNALYPQDWQRQLNALLRAVWEEHDDALEYRLVRHAVAETVGTELCEIIEAREEV